ncbi:hypothetical protein MCOR27_002271 [Pyricularia oryzae]|uniref:SnoaL-like domain-containing protein n=2 Tax=Pyricularia TaxID=48558 RepID=A0ABQ8NI85_PYRGI|nr:hypothetical protein MCOR01_006189 [Pyricularia oryzae]KAI6297484.1 hypothetical protein MCOR33_006214 [Pyricularia grisea]KAH9435502.1 hypothetical protein MCOR02_004432 [Pyricularia oryzae]KAI6258412.1 hypothetical protein MCOR19_005215 [Pyricularia oryzae]KAI6270850.1 hypothetical protein MCOR26_008064 [Pyricularia oryzae]
MHLITIVVAALTAGRLMWAMPTPESDPEMLRARATFCEKMNPPPSEEETATRFAEFADAFIFEKDIDAAFSYIAPEYINHNPAAQNGAQFAYDLLKPFWASQNITVLGTLYRHPQGWLNYRSAFGTIVDRYRWDGGCIVEHWDAGEQMPTDVTPGEILEIDDE